MIANFIRTCIIIDIKSSLFCLLVLCTRLVDVLHLQDLLWISVKADLHKGISKFLKRGSFALLELLYRLLQERLRRCLS